MTDDAPKTVEGIQEADRMNRARRLSSGFWNATGWLLKLLGASAFFTVGLRLASAPGRIAVSWYGLAALFAVLAGAGAYGLMQVITGSRIRTADQAAHRRPGAYSLLAVLLLAQTGSLVVSPVLQGLAVFESLRQGDPRLETNAGLADRLDLYGTNYLALDLVKDYCTKHTADTHVSHYFLTACLQFTQLPPPSQKEANILAQSLRSR